MAPFRRIPGPAGALQEALRRGEPAKRIEDGSGAGPDGAASSSSSGADPNVGTPRAEDSPWFKLSSWRNLLDALDLETFDPASPLLRTNVAWILNGGWRGQRVHRLAVVIIDAFETPFGDLKVVLADPTGAIRCTVHRDTVASDPFAIRKGGALLLKDVPVLTVAEYTEQYLCVTDNELVRAFKPSEAFVDAADQAAARERERREAAEATAGTAAGTSRRDAPCDSQALPAPSRSPSRPLESPGPRPAEDIAEEMHAAVEAAERARAEIDARMDETAARARGRRAENSCGDTRGRRRRRRRPRARTIQTGGAERVRSRGGGTVKARRRRVVEETRGRIHTRAGEAGE